MPVTNFPFGVASFGVPIIGNPVPAVTGKYFFVNSRTGQDSNAKGDAPDRPFKTVAYAITKCVSQRGDCIVVAQGHTEDIASAGAITVNKSAVQIVGLGIGDDRPTFTFKTVVGATLVVSSYNTLLQNLIFDYTGITGITTGISITGFYTRMADCKFIMGSAAAQCSVAVTLGSADDVVFTRCDFVSPNAGPTVAIKGALACKNLRIHDCRFWGNFSTACINNITNAWTQVELMRNRMYVSSATGIGISVLAGTTGVIADNYTFVTANIAVGGSIAAAGAALFNNQGMEVAHAGASAQLDPAAGGFA